MKVQTLLWSDLKEIINNLFDEYDGDFGLRWLEKVWSITISRGEADYLTIYDKNQVHIRLITLIIIYAEFKSIFFSQDPNLYLENVYEFLDKSRLHLDEKLIYDQPLRRDLFFEILEKIIASEKKKYCKLICTYYSNRCKQDDVETDLPTEYLTRDIISELIVGDDFDTLFYVANYKSEEIDKMKEEEFYERIARVNSWIQNDMQNTD